MRLGAKDRAMVALLAFFSVFNLTLDLALIRRGAALPSLVGRDWIADLWSWYAEADRFWVAASWSLAQEWFNVWVTTLVNVVLIAGIVRATPWRYPLQLTLGAYLSYSCLQYFLIGHLGGYEGMRARTPRAFAMFYGLTLPWLAAHAWLAADAFVVITRRLGASARS